MQLMDAVWAVDGLDDAPRLLLLRMARSARDGDAEPWSGLAMVERARALGKHDDRAGRSAVGRVVGILTRAGYLRLIAGGNRSGVARYALMDGTGSPLRPVDNAEKGTHSLGTIPQERYPLSERKVPTELAKGTHSVGTQGGKRKKRGGGTPPHPHEENVRATLQRLRPERHWPDEVTDDELVGFCYEANPEDPWPGWQAIDSATNVAPPDGRVTAGWLRGCIRREVAR